MIIDERMVQCNQFSICKKTSCQHRKEHYRNMLCGVLYCKHVNRFCKCMEVEHEKESPEKEKRNVL